MTTKVGTKTQVISGLAFHCHHDTLVEYVTDYEERVSYITTHKPKEEIELRLRLFRMIPDDRISDEINEAGKAYTEARRAYNEAGKAKDEAWKAKDEAWKAYNEAWKAYTEAEKAVTEALKAYNEAWKAYTEARRAYTEAGKAYNEAWKAKDEAWKAYTEAGKDKDEYFNELHTKLCPDCPWDGSTIFPAGKEKE